MKNKPFLFHDIELKNNHYAFLISTTSDGVFYDIGMVYQTLRDHHFIGDCLIDTYLSSGSKQHRFMHAYFDGEGFQRLTPMDDEWMRQRCKQMTSFVWKEKSNLFDISHLTPAQGFCFQRGI